MDPVAYIARSRRYDAESHLFIKIGYCFATIKSYEIALFFGQLRQEIFDDLCTKALQTKCRVTTYRTKNKTVINCFVERKNPTLNTCMR